MKLLLRRALLAALVAGVIAPVSAGVFVRRVGTVDMEPSLHAGDWIWVLPVEPTPGDIVLIDDPAHPGHTVMRRILAGAGQRVQWDDGGFRVNGKRVRQQDKDNSVEGQVTARETLWSLPPAVATKWQVRRLDPILWETESQDVPANHWYVLGDNRVRAVDSRWVGPIPHASVRGVIRARWGKETDRHPARQWLTGVGPFKPARKRR